MVQLVVFNSQNYQKSTTQQFYNPFLFKLCPYSVHNEYGLFWNDPQRGLEDLFVCEETSHTLQARDPKPHYSSQSAILCPIWNTHQWRSGTSRKAHTQTQWHYRLFTDSQIYQGQRSPGRGRQILRCAWRMCNRDPSVSFPTDMPPLLKQQLPLMLFLLPFDLPLSLLPNSNRRSRPMTQLWPHSGRGKSNFVLTTMRDTLVLCLARNSRHISITVLMNLYVPGLIANPQQLHPFTGQSTASWLV